MINIGVIGNGFVGKATQLFALCPSVKCLVYDIDPDKCVPRGVTPKRLSEECDLVFICVPTPMNVLTGECNIKIVEQCVNELTASRARIVVRSTVPPGTCEKLGVSHMPEYLTEARWRDDFINANEWHLGTSDDGAAKLFVKLIEECYQSGVIKSKTCVIKTTGVTECAKYFKNTALAVKVALFNEFEQYCRAIDVDYSQVRELVISDPRIGGSHTVIPGPDGRRGFGGTCFPKDISGLIRAMEDADVRPYILTAAKIRNETVDRPECEWLQNFGRAVSGP